MKAVLCGGGTFSQKSAIKLIKPITFVRLPIVRLMNKISFPQSSKYRLK